MGPHKRHTGDQLASFPRRPRLKVSNACQVCRLRKAKCDGRLPDCGRCKKRGKKCTYIRDSRAVEKQARHTSPIQSHDPVPVSRPKACARSSEGLSRSNSKVNSAWNEYLPVSGSLNADQCLKPNQDQTCYTAHGRFASEVIATIDVRAGLTPTATSKVVPFVDAPLFGELDLDFSGAAQSLSIELPLRAYAEKLVAIYWQYIEPVEPVLDKERFSYNFEAIYNSAGAFSYANNEVWLSILYIVFALAVQRNESTLLQSRQKEANGYFQRAWALIRPEKILWNPGSIELVQCLMLMNRYLHCTNNQHKTWMTAGLAMRIAQSMCCHVSEGNSGQDTLKNKLLKQKVWASCVALDRCVSWSLGKTLAPSLVLLSNNADSMTLLRSYQQDEDIERLRRGLELHEIGNQIQLAQTQTRLGEVAKLGLPRPYQQEEYHAVAVQLDACLNKWEQNLPNHLKLQNIANITDRRSRTEGCLVHLRLLHSRIFLYRPMLARFLCLKCRVTTPGISRPASLSDRLLRQWAGMCIEAAQEITSLIVETLRLDEPFGILPWWYRIFYLHIAGINFLAAMFEPELYTESVSQSWRDVMSTLRKHEHLSTYVQQCMETFDTLSTKILETRCPEPDADGKMACDMETSASYFDDLFQDIVCDFDEFLFTTNDSSTAIASHSERSTGHGFPTYE